MKQAFCKDSVPCFCHCSAIFFISCAIKQNKEQPMYAAMYGLRVVAVDSAKLHLTRKCSQCAIDQTGTVLLNATRKDTVPRVAFDALGGIQMPICGHFGIQNLCTKRCACFVRTFLVVKLTPLINRNCVIKCHKRRHSSKGRF